MLAPIKMATPNSLVSHAAEGPAIMGSRRGACTALGDVPADVQCEWPLPKTSLRPVDRKTGKDGAAPSQRNLRSTLLPPPAYGQTMLPSSIAPKQECSPRCVLSPRRRPLHLDLDGSHGATAATPADLRHAILTTCTTGCPPESSTDLVAQPIRSPVILTSKAHEVHTKLLVSVKRAAPPVALPIVPRRPVHGSCPCVRMGNQQSNHARLTNGALQSPAAASTSTLDEDGHSMDSVVRSPKLKPSKHAPRQSSLNLLKKKGGPHASKVPKDLTTTVIEVPRAATAPNLDLVGDGDAYEVTEEGGIENDKFRHAKTLSSPSPTYPAPGGSPDTITEKSATRPISAGTTVSACSARRLDPIDGGRDSSSPYLRVSALSPTLPAPPPVPEDSPHKYGLKDNMETPEPPSPPLELDAVKARRRSSGIEIFNVRLSRPALMAGSANRFSGSKEPPVRIVLPQWLEHCSPPR